MRAVFGVVSLLLVLAVVGVLAMKQLKAVDKGVGASLPPAQTATDAPAAAMPASTLPARAQQAQQRAAAEVGKALEQGAARTEAADK
jgi:hypothetical protein